MPFRFALPQPLHRRLHQKSAIKPGTPLHLPGAPFLLAAVILLSAFPVAAYVTRVRAS